VIAQAEDVDLEKVLTNLKRERDIAQRW